MSSCRSLKCRFGFPSTEKPLERIAIAEHRGRMPTIEEMERMSDEEFVERIRDAEMRPRSDSEDVLNQLKYLPDLKKEAEELYRRPE
jgi:hypothetical protein